MKIRKVQWAYGVTTVRDRLDTTLPITLTSLHAAGFESPRLFVDGDDGPEWAQFGLPLTFRVPKIRTFGNWVLALGELLIRDPKADRYAIFQDDMIAVRSLRAYLDTCPLPEKKYLNLFTFMDNEAIIAGQRAGTWHEACEVLGPNGKPGSHPHHWQTGRGAVALVFSRQGVIDLLTSLHMVQRPTDAARPWKRVDGAIVAGMNKAGYRELVHSPSLVQHTGEVSSMGNKKHPLARTFPGEAFDAREFCG